MEICKSAIFLFYLFFLWPFLTKKTFSRFLFTFYCQSIKYILFYLFLLFFNSNLF
uniref:Uncharacterized protein n=1 Tax=Meloidogyne enterolobii TaxID=390850 RepID=A0A6V7X3Z1_MELEN|nr:unnamed protein product [Meloidogyne enterolobii]